MSDHQQEKPEQSPDRSSSPRVWKSAELFGKAKLVQIEHGDEVYQLRITRHGKLILNK